MVQAWPKIQTLRLDPDVYCPLAGRWVTLHDLEPLALHCPELTLLGILIDCTTANNASAPDSPEPPSTSQLIKLRVGDSKISSPTHMAAYLSYLFPKLVRRIKSFARYKPDTSDFEDDTDGVNEMLDREFCRKLWSEVANCLALTATAQEDLSEDAFSSDGDSSSEL